MNSAAGETSPWALAASIDACMRATGMTVIITTYSIADMTVENPLNTMKIQATTVTKVECAAGLPLVFVIVALRTASAIKLGDQTGKSRASSIIPNGAARNEVRGTSVWTIRLRSPMIRDVNKKTGMRRVEARRARRWKRRCRKA